MSALPSLLGMLPEDLDTHLRAQGFEARPEELRRVLSEVISHGKTEIAPRRGVARRLLEVLESSTTRQGLEQVERVADPEDRFVKYLFRSPDGSLTEAVRIPLAKPGCFTVCLSSQVGCAMQCDFCATGRLRNLEAWEMVAALLAVRADAPGRVTGVVFQGQGEPFHNYDEVIQAARVLSHPNGGRISARAITISTVGLVPQIRRYTEEGHKFRLILSLTSAVPAKREKLLPVAGKFAIEDLAEAMRAYDAQSKGRTTLAWVLMDGVNTGDDEVAAIRAFAEGLNLRFNLIDVNDAREDGYRAPSDEVRKRFMDGLQVLGAPLVRRYSGGGRRHAACGMLASTRWDDEERPTGVGLKEGGG